MVRILFFSIYVAAPFSDLMKQPLSLFFVAGTFTFMNGTASTSETGEVSCYRNPAYADWWWYNPPPDWSLFIIVPVFAFSLALWFGQDWKSRDMVVSTLVASLGYLVNYFVKPVSRHKFVLG